MSGALVGPLHPVRYASGPTQYHDLPRNTLDIRYAACGNHHLACDCREAQNAEDIGEYRAMIRQLEQAIIEATEGHQTWAYGGCSEWLGFSADDVFAQCKCQLCGIRRDLFIGYTRCMAERTEASRKLAAELDERERQWFAQTRPDDSEEVPF